MFVSGSLFRDNTGVPVPLNQGSDKEGSPLPKGQISEASRQLVQEAIPVMGKLWANIEESEKIERLILAASDPKVARELTQLLEERLDELDRTQGSSNEVDCITHLCQILSLVSKHATAIIKCADKLVDPKPLTFEECRLIDEIGKHKQAIFALGRIYPSSEHTFLGRLNAILTIAEKNTFADFQDGDLLLYDCEDMNAYYGQDVPLVDKATMLALSSPFTHVGVFFRDFNGNPCIAEIMGQFSTSRLTFGQQSYITRRRVNPNAFTAKKIEGEERTTLQNKFGQLFATTVTQKHWDIKYSVSRGVQSVLVSHREMDNKTLKLGVARLQNNVKMLCSEFVAVGLVHAFEAWNKSEQEQLREPFPRGESAAGMHPGRLLHAFGYQPLASERGWEEPQMSNSPFRLPIRDMLPNYRKT